MNHPHLASIPRELPVREGEYSFVILIGLRPCAYDTFLARSIHSMDGCVLEPHPHTSVNNDRTTNIITLAEDRTWNHYQHCIR